MAKNPLTGNSNSSNPTHPPLQNKKVRNPRVQKNFFLNQ